MTQDPTKAAEALADVLERENEALKRLDPQAAAGFVAAKEAAMHDLAAIPFVAEPGLLAVTRRLGGLAAENRVLLDRAIKVQARVIQIIAGAYRPPPGTVRYGRSGTPAVPVSTGVALSTRA